MSTDGPVGTCTPFGDESLGRQNVEGWGTPGEGGKKAENARCGYIPQSPHDGHHTIVVDRRGRERKKKKKPHFKKKGFGDYSGVKDLRS